MEDSNKFSVVFENKAAEDLLAEGLFESFLVERIVEEQNATARREIP